jgi:hypothetical protein
VRAILFAISLKRLQLLPAPATKANVLALADWKKRTAFQLKILLYYAGQDAVQSARRSNG